MDTLTNKERYKGRDIWRERESEREREREREREKRYSQISFMFLKKKILYESHEKENE